MNSAANAKDVRTMFVMSRPSSLFKSRVFDEGVQEALLPKPIALHLDEVRSGAACFDKSFADEIADALQDWAAQNGATHFMHWFQPLRNGYAEKQASFLHWHQGFEACEKLTGKQLLLGESDASSLPSGGLRPMHQAKGYTCWDPASFPFLWETEGGLTLCIPAIFYSWAGVAIDQKIPLLRSNQKLSASLKRLLHLCKIEGSTPFSTLCAEQEYFLIERNLFGLRPDLALCGRTLFGALPAKGEELGDHYFSAVSDKALGFMREFEEAALRIGIPIKTRHNEVAPSQHEVAPLAEPLSAGVDHNLLLMEVMKRTAAKMGLTCLFHEKPFGGVSGSAKQCSWSLATDDGLNLLEPKKESLLFLTLLTAILRAIHEHAGLLRASIGSAGNDHRLGAADAPPAIVSVFLGEALERLVMEIVYEKPRAAALTRQIELDLSHISAHEVDSTDLNRTSFFAFDVDHFALRAMGSAQSCAFPLAILNAVVADSLQLILDEIDDVVKDRKEVAESALLKLAMPVLRKHLTLAMPILFSGDNHSDEWCEQARSRGLPNIARSFHAFGELRAKKSIRSLEGVFSEQELSCRFDVLVEEYAKTLNVEANVMVEMFQTQILPAVEKDLERKLALLDAAQAFNLKMSQGSVQRICEMLEMSTSLCEEVKKLQDQSSEMGWEAKGRIFCELIAPKMDELRQQVDALELLVDDELWPIPKYREILYSL